MEGKEWVVRVKGWVGEEREGSKSVQFIIWRDVYVVVHASNREALCSLMRESRGVQFTI